MIGRPRERRAALQSHVAPGMRRTNFARRRTRSSRSCSLGETSQLSRAARGRPQPGLGGLKLAWGGTSLEQPTPGAGGRRCHFEPRCRLIRWRMRRGPRVSANPMYRSNSVRTIRLMANGRTGQHSFFARGPWAARGSAPPAGAARDGNPRPRFRSAPLTHRLERAHPASPKSATRTTLPVPPATSAAGGHPNGRGFRVA